MDGYVWFFFFFFSRMKRMSWTEKKTNAELMIEKMLEDRPHQKMANGMYGPLIKRGRTQKLPYVGNYWA